MKFPVIILLLSLILCGCESRQSLPAFTTVGERSRTVELQRDPDEPERYLLEEPVVVTRVNQAFYLRYRGGGSGAAVRIPGGNDRDKDGLEMAAKALPRALEAVVYLPLERGWILKEFWIDAVEAPLEESLELVEVGITDAVSGYENSGDLLTVGTTVQILSRGGSAVRLDLGAPEGWPLQRSDGSSVEAVVRPAGVHPRGAESASEQGGVLQSGTPPSYTQPATTGWQIALVLETAPPFDYGDFHFHESLANLEAGSNLAEAAAESAAKRTSILLRLQSADRSVSFRHSALPGEYTLFLYHGMVSFTPETLSIEPLAGAVVWLESFEIVRLVEDAAGSPVAAGGIDGDDTPAAELSPGAVRPAALQPLPADPGAVLLYDPEAWRQSEYELFAWSRFPQILIMDTASYDLQSRFFKRLAFFVEKQGYRGRLVSNEEFAGLHGFNAHDYRAEDLARFFQAVRDELFALNPEEELLEQILLANGIIRDDGVFSPGKGGILSISRGSYPILRRHLLTHECAHGLFFSLPEFREASFKAWDRLPEREQDFWKLFFRWVGYDTDDPYLTVNEYQAYLFQQPRAGVRYYFTALTTSRLVSSYPGEASWVEDLISSDPERFTRAFDDLEISLVKIAGLEGGRVIELESAESQ